MTSLAQYDRARAALAEATRIEDVLPILDEIEHVKLYARQIADRELLAEASTFQMKAERQLGIVIAAAKEAGHFRQGRQPVKKSEGEVFPRAILQEVGVDHKLSVRAQKAASISQQAFEAMVANMRERIASGAATVVDKVAATQEKQQRRANRERVLGGLQCALPEEKFGVILADSEWRFEPWSRETGMDRAADNHYPTSCTEVIASRDVLSIAAEDSVLFLWATAPMLPHAFTVMAAWGFDYKSHVIWRKPAPITGYWFRSVHELLLVGTRGAIPAPAMGTQPASVIDAPSTKHSAKPEVFLEMIEAYFPTLPKIELNRRGPARKGWSAWGNESIDPSTGEITSSQATEAA